MAKALLGYVGGSDPRLLSEMRRLQQRVQDLESELTRIQSENDALNAAAFGREPRVRPPIRGVIVLTVKLFGETLKAPRTFAVWRG